MQVLDFQWKFNSKKVIWLNEFSNVALLLWSYTFIYNLALLVVFATIFQVINFNLKTVYALSNFGATNVFTKLLVLSLFSMAGVPPFLGFFSKLFILLLLFNSNFFLLFSFFFILFFTGLYFYMQNIRFLNTTASASFSYPSNQNLRLSTLYFILTYPTAFFLVFGFFYIEDLFLLISWIFS